MPGGSAASAWREAILWDVPVSRVFAGEELYAQCMEQLGATSTGVDYSEPHDIIDRALTAGTATPTTTTATAMSDAVTTTTTTTNSVAAVKAEPSVRANAHNTVKT
jgi:hypothetical protein